MNSQEIGILGQDNMVRSNGDQQLLRQFRACSEPFQSRDNEQIGVLGSDAFNRSKRDVEMLKQFNPCGFREGYNGMASIMDDPYNSLSTTARKN
jgi:hypothetical protein